MGRTHLRLRRRSVTCPMGRSRCQTWRRRRPLWPTRKDRPRGSMEIPTRRACYLSGPRRGRRSCSPERPIVVERGDRHCWFRESPRQFRRRAFLGPSVAAVHRRWLLPAERPAHGGNAASSETAVHGAAGGVTGASGVGGSSFVTNALAAAGRQVERFARWREQARRSWFTKGPRVATGSRRGPTGPSRAADELSLGATRQPGEAGVVRRDAAGNGTDFRHRGHRDGRIRVVEQSGGILPAEPPDGPAALEPGRSVGRADGLGTRCEAEVEVAR